MNCWVAFDERTAEKIYGAGHANIMLADPQSHDPLQLALAAESDAVLLLPATSAGDVLILNIRKHSAATPPSEPRGSFVATGFLGLIDEPVYESAPEPPRKWWQKLLD